MVINMGVDLSNSKFQCFNIIRDIEIERHGLEPIIF